MARKPSPEATSVWEQLMRVQHVVMTGVEHDLKKAGLPPLSWYGALLHLTQAPEGELRPLELEKLLKLPQYTMSRMLDRMVEAGLVERRSCPSDGRGQYIVITAEGRNMFRSMTPPYMASIEAHIGSKLPCTDAAKLSQLLEKLC